MSAFNGSNRREPDFRSDEIHVKVDAEERTVSLTFQLLGEFHTMNRGYDELVEKTLHRFSITCRSKLAKTSNKAARSAKKQTKNSGTEEAQSAIAKPEPPVLTYDSQVVDAAAIQNFELKTGMAVVLDSQTYTVVVNPPTVTSLSAYPKQLLYVGCPVVPQVTIEFGDEFSCLWAVEKTDASGGKAFEVVCREKLFVPSAEYEGCRVKLFCTAHCSASGRSGRAVVFYLAGAVQPGFTAVREFNRMVALREPFCAVRRASRRVDAPALFDMLASNGSSSTKGECEVNVGQELRGEHELRVITYNILAEPFATSDQAYTTLYPYCDPAYLQSEYRIQRILAELVACDADVICLQECDLRTFECYLLPLLGRLGYEGHFTCKGSTEGCAVFTYTETCAVVARVDLPLKNVLREAPYLETLYELRPDLRDVLGGKLGTVAQITILQSVHRPDRALVVANTHLFYHPLASFLRAIQAYAITQALGAIKTAIESAQCAEWWKQDFITLVQGEETNQVMQDKQHRLERTLFFHGWVTEHLPASAPIEKSEQVKASAVFCGDLNSSPDIAAMQLLTKGFATEEQLGRVWEELKYFYWGDRESNFSFTSIHEACRLRQQQQEHRGRHHPHVHKHRHGTSQSPRRQTSEQHQHEEAVGSEHAVVPAGGEEGEEEGQERAVRSEERSEDEGKEDCAGLLRVLRHSLNLFSAAGYAPFSNYTPTFQHLLDYILVPTEDFTVVRVAECPGHEVLGEFTALPSQVIPSDHISIAVDLCFKD